VEDDHDELQKQWRLTLMAVWLSSSICAACKRKLIAFYSGVKAAKSRVINGHAAPSRGMFITVLTSFIRQKSNKNTKQ